MWLKDSMLPLPVGTKMVRVAHFLSTTLVAAFPSRQIWTWNMGWTGEVLSIGEWTGEVYHVPQPQSAPKPTILPPAEMPEALRPYWTPESRVYLDSAKGVRVYPSGKLVVPGSSTVFQSVFSEHTLSPDFLLPNRTVATESILGTASAAKAVEQGVADAVEGRTVEVPAVRLAVNKTDDRVISKPDPLDQLAAEAQAEGEYAKTPKPLRPAGEVAEEGILEVVARLVEDQYLGVYAPNGIVRHLREAVHAAGLSGPVNARIMADAIEKDRRARP